MEGALTRTKAFRAEQTQGARPALEVLRFQSLRSDWYVGNGVLPRLFCACLSSKRRIFFVGFPRQWIPVFEWYRMEWKQSIPPGSYMPFFSDLEEKDIVGITREAQAKKCLRVLVESASVYDPVVSDFLYIVDNRVPASPDLLRADLSEFNGGISNGGGRLLLNGWQAYGRPSVRSLERQALGVISHLPYAVALPCARKRPYGNSRTHRKIYDYIKSHGYDLRQHHKIVITSIGVLPEELWESPQVLSYDAGVPDIYRTLRLVRSFFSRQNYEYVLDCLQFEPYSDVLRIAEREGVIREVRRLKTGRSRHFFLRP